MFMGSEVRGARVLEHCDPTVDVVASPAKTIRAKKDAGEERATGCKSRRLDSDYAASVKICEG